MEQINTDLIGLSVAVIAIILATISLYRSKTTQNALLQYEKVQAELSNQPAAVSNTASAQSSNALIDVSIVDGSLLISNDSTAIAKNVNLTFKNDNHNCILSAELAQLPLAQLKPNEQIRLVASYHTSSAPKKIEVEVSWLNADGSQGSAKKLIKN